ncbi:hypothetical protein B0H19DRAFT_1084448 [Mycena capillaripes]|nr:hypothetical protein B0H19DRAFT_1084448 [Mycena capillaripes]
MQSSDDELSATSEDEKLTPAEKARRTRALNLAEERAANERLSKETAGGRSAKKTALKNKIWDTSKGSASNSGRKRAVSGTAEQPKRAKKAKPQSQSLPEPQDDMEVDEESPAVPEVKNASKKASTSVPQTKKAEGSGKEAPARNRRYIPDTIQTSDDESSAPQDHGSNKSLKPAANPAARKSKAPAATAETIPKVKSKPKKTIVIDDDDEDNVPIPSEPEDPVLDIERECAQIIQPKRQPVAPDPEALFSSDDDDRKPRHRRQASSSSMGSMPPDTDIDFDFEALHQDDEDDADEEAEDSDEEAEEAQVVPGNSVARGQRFASRSSVKRQGVLRRVGSKVFAKTSVLGKT